MTTGSNWHGKVIAERGIMNGSNYPNSATFIIPCACGSSDTYWQGSSGGVQVYCCDVCWEDDELRSRCERRESKKENHMSRELDYFPPNGTKCEWGAKALNHSCWTSFIPGISPLTINLSVDLIDGQHTWHVRVSDFEYALHTYSGTKPTALEACREAERVGKEKFEELVPEWARKAFENGWRPSR